MGDPDKIKQLYSTVSKDYDVGTYDEFAGKMQDSAKRKAFYDFASKSYDLGDYTSFESKVVKKKDLSPVSQPTSKTTGTNTLSPEKVNEITSYLSKSPVSVS